MARTQVQAELIATNAISGTIIADNAITATHIAQNSISGILIPDSGITTTMIASNNVTAAKIVSDGIETRHLHSNVVSGLSAVTPVAGDYLLAGDTSDSNNLKKILVSGITGLVSTPITALNNATANELVTIGSTTTELDAEANLVFDGNDLGIGVTSPASAAGNTAGLHIKNSAPYIRLQDDSGTASDWEIYAFDDKLHFYDNTNSAIEMTIDGDGKLGLGTHTPDGNLHIMSASAGSVSAHASADELVVEGSGNAGINILSANNGEGGLYFGDDGDNDIGRIRYDHSNNTLDFFVNASERFSIGSSGQIGLASANYGTDGQILTSAGAGAAAAWEDAGGGGASDIDGLSDAKSGGTDFASSLFLGHQTTGTLSAASQNTAVGYITMDSITQGDQNTAMGYGALTANTTGHMNTAFGFQTLATTSTNLTDEQTAVGYAALENSVGEKNTAVGAFAGTGLTDGVQNTLIGYDAGNAAMEQDYNTCVGAYSGTALTTGAGFNTAVGKSALAGGTTSNYVVAVGTNAAGGGVLTGNAIVAIGHNAGYSLTAATNSVFVGQGAGGSVTDGISNTAVGMDSLQACVGAGYNTTVGHRAGYVVVGQRNTLMGYYAGAGITSGAYNTIVGSTCYQSAADGNYQMIFGYDVTSVGDSTMTIGKGSNTCSISLDGSDTSWAAASDIRLKDNIEDSLAGLDFINELRPITYKWKLKKDVPTDMFEYEDSDEPCKGTGKTNHGFIAQEVKAIIDKYDSVKDGNNIWDVADSGTENVAPSALIPMLVKAVQELSAEVKELKKEK